MVAAACRGKGRERERVNRKAKFFFFGCLWWWFCGLLVVVATSRGRGRERERVNFFCWGLMVVLRVVGDGGGGG